MINEPITNTIQHHFYMDKRTFITEPYRKLYEKVEKEDHVQARITYKDK